MFKILAFMTVATVGATQLTHVDAKPRFAAACRVADSTTADEIDHWKSKMHSVNPVDSADVINAALLYVADSAFAVVTDSTLCAAAVAGHNAEAGYSTTELTTPAAATVYAIRVGTRYITWNTSFASGEYIYHSVWSSSFGVLSHYF